MPEQGLLSDYIHPSGDKVITHLGRLNNILGGIIRAYPGKDLINDNPTWLDYWFRNRSVFFASESTPKSDNFGYKEFLQEFRIGNNKYIDHGIKLISLWPHYFRGLRDVPKPIQFHGNLIVIDGRNSSGKTSLSEALEWLLTGQLIRRTSQLAGDPKELENCISNQLIPEGETTWVEGVFNNDNDVIYTIKRILIKDYAATQSSKAESDFYVNGKKLSNKEEVEFLDLIFGSIPPILMQHTLRLFVNSTCAQRREYFEKLLQLDELTFLIEKAVIGDSRLSEFPSSVGSVGWKNWEKLIKTTKTPNSKTNLRSILKVNNQDLSNMITQTLLLVAKVEFDEVSHDEKSINRANQQILEQQRLTRQFNFPLLEKLRPKKIIDRQLIEDFSKDSFSDKFKDIKESYNDFNTADKAKKVINQAKFELVKVIDILRKNGLLQDTSDDQICPVCDYQEMPTLTSSRLELISSMEPTQKAYNLTLSNFEKYIDIVIDLLNTFTTTIPQFFPQFPSEKEWEESLAETNDNIISEANNLRETYNDCNKEISGFISRCSDLKKELSEVKQSPIDPNSLASEISIISSSLASVIENGQKYSDSFAKLENIIGSQSKEDPDYNLREVWIDTHKSQETVRTDVIWEKSKILAQSELKDIRDQLIAIRSGILLFQREIFNTGMTNVWKKLRSDDYSVFSQLFIPEPAGKGYPVKIEVKAILSDGISNIEVDALKVFSESQVNVVGLASFITRSKLLGHKMIVFDDPVQSMDEEHFKTFSCEILPDLLESGFQVIIFTHNDTFAREISHNYYEYDGYTTMKIVHSKRIGCRVEDGNRRVSERLLLAEHFCEDSNLDSGWYYVRLAIERLYTITYIKYGESDFNPIAWSRLSAEAMWNNGVSSIIQKKIPEESARLKEILDMTASGTHDRPPNGITDLNNSIRDMRKILQMLRLGGG